MSNLLNESDLSVRETFGNEADFVTKITAIDVSDIQALILLAMLMSGCLDGTVPSPPKASPKSDDGFTEI